VSIAPAFFLLVIVSQSVYIESLRNRYADIYWYKYLFVSYILRYWTLITVTNIRCTSSFSFAILIFWTIDGKKKLFCINRWF